jgi:hypothetical protein
MTGTQTAADLIKHKLRTAAAALGTADPQTYIGPLIDRSFPLPPGSSEYAANALTPGAVPCEPSFSETEPRVLRFTIMPLDPRSSPASRRDEATREMRGLVGRLYGSDALHWFDHHSEEWRGTGSHSRLGFGAWFGTAYDEDGLQSAKVYYEMRPEQLEALPVLLRALVHTAREAMPGLLPVFTTIRCGRHEGSQRVSFLHQGPLRLADLHPLMERLGLGHHLPSVMQVVGVSLGGRFDLPARSVLLGLREAGEGPELKLEVLLGMLPDLPPTFLDLLTLGLSERPRQLHALGRWLRAFTPPSSDWPGDFSVLSVRTTPRTPARVSLYLRPVEFEVRRRLADIPGLGASPASAVA